MTLGQNALQVANSYDEFDGQTVIDLGCGTVSSRTPPLPAVRWTSTRGAPSGAGSGRARPFEARGPPTLPCRRAALQAMLSIGAAMLGARHVVGVDVDEDALRIAQQNVDEYEDPLPVGAPRTSAQALRTQPARLPVFGHAVALPCECTVVRGQKPGTHPPLLDCHALASVCGTHHPALKSAFQSAALPSQQQPSPWRPGQRCHAPPPAPLFPPGRSTSFAAMCGRWRDRHGYKQTQWS